ncbi:MAG TPA: valine--tRNA ligase [Candidatus Saccharimonadales bacterium]
MNLDKNYDPVKYETKIYQDWLDNEVFKSTNHSQEYFSIVLPPPNANANLHLGHNLTVAIEDISARYNRMLGRDTVFIPGADHAGFETWVVYEAKLNREGKTRFDFTDKQLFDQVWDFVDKNKQIMLNQLKLMGISADWDKFTYTLDTKVVNQAYRTFKKMWDDGLIYRGERLVNYCTFHGTSFSDIEVVYKNQAGKLWYLNYPIKDSLNYITVATTRPETMLGDVAIAVNPKDKRYLKLIGKTVILPLAGREIPILSDPMVESEFGTGAVKITPAHDINDYDLAERHNLPMISVINKQGKMDGEIPKIYLGLDVDEARKEIISDLKKLNLLDKVEDYSNRVGHCYKCNTIIQPLLSKQWFVSMKPLAKKAIERLKKSEIQFYPSSKLKQSIEYLENIRDWNISRQIAWGIPIPAFQNNADEDDWIFDKRVDQDEITIDGKTYVRDSDVFDTWFSSGQWPYTVLDYPDSEYFKKFYPLTLMETGGEILYQWVCRMIILGVYITNEVPFKNVYIHGYVLADDGSKMSKSIGNVVDPIPLIKKYGSDAVRIGLIIGRSAGINRGFDIRKIEEGRNFANKLWNLTRFITSKIPTDFTYNDKPIPMNPQDEWILSQLIQTTELTTDLLENYRYGEAFDRIYRFVWDDFADWYIECSKSELNISVLSYCFNNILKLTHSFAPFVSEVIWRDLNWSKVQFLATSNWPKFEPSESKTDNDFQKIINLTTEIRFISASLIPGTKLDLEFNNNLVDKQADLLKNLAKLSSIKKVNAGQGLKLQSIDNIWLNISEQEITKFIDSLKQQRQNQQIVSKNLEKRLENRSYLEKAPSKVIEETKNDLSNAKSTLENLDKQIKNFQIS